VSGTPPNAGSPGTVRRRRSFGRTTLGDDFFACQPIAKAIHQVGGRLYPDLQAIVARDRVRIPAWRTGTAPPDGESARQADHDDLPQAVRGATARHR
jgi:hypothetical protein